MSLVLFYSTSCGHCPKLLRHMKARKLDKFVSKVDVGASRGMEMASENGVEVVPTLLLIDGRGAKSIYSGEDCSSVVEIIDIVASRLRRGSTRLRPRDSSDRDVRLDSIESVISKPVDIDALIKEELDSRKESEGRLDDQPGRAHLAEPGRLGDIFRQERESLEGYQYNHYDNVDQCVGIDI